MRRLLPLALVASMLTLVLAACSSDEPGNAAEADKDSTVTQVEQSPSASPTPSPPDLPSDDDLLFLVEALASGSVSQMDSALALTVKGSLAHAYLLHQIAVENAYIDGGYESKDAGETQPQGKGYETCYTTDDGPPNCYVFSDFEGADGKVVDFTVNRLDLKNRLTVGNGRFISGDGMGLKGKFVSAYMTANGDNLSVAFQLRTSDTPVSIAQASYRSPNGRQSDSNSITGVFDLGERSLSNFAVQFPGAQMGGVLTLTYYVEGGSDATIAFKTG